MEHWLHRLGTIYENYVLGAKKKRLPETFILRTQIICFIGKN